MRRALIIGLDQYAGNPLHGCVSDAQKLNEILSRHADDQRNFECQMLTAPPEKVTKALLRRKITELFRQPAGIAFLHFSGHGTINGLGGYLVTPDYCDYDVGMPMTEILAMANQSQINAVFITLDCCHSGAFGTLPYVSNDKIVLREGISVITATRAGQEALEANGNGVFSSLLIEALEGGAASLLGNVTAASVYAYIDDALGAWDQRPMFKAHVSSFACLRRAEPKIELRLLRKIVNYFPLPAEKLPLSPEYEPTAEPHNVEKEGIFGDLLEFKNVGLVEPIEAPHMYFAAIESKACSLTTLGKYYWRLVREGKI